ncbi:hypothetical protein P7C73_g2237, partial [Tremellales sp. Uapishka_1]
MSWIPSVCSPLSTASLWRRPTASGALVTASAWWKRSVFFCATLSVGCTLYLLAGEQATNLFYAATPSPDPIASLFPVPYHESRDYREWNALSLELRGECIWRQDCVKNQEKVVLLATDWAIGGVIGGWSGGEGVWARSMYKALRQLGYTVLFTETAWQRDLPDRYTAVEKFDMKFFPGAQWWDLGGKWVLSADHLGAVGEPEQYIEENQYIGYSLEEQYVGRELVPREEKRSAWLFAKEATYFYMDQPFFAFNRSYFEMATKEPSLAGLTFEGAYNIDDHYFHEKIKDGPLEPIPGVENHGRLGPEAFLNHIARSIMIVGIGEGVPFLNPIKEWDVEDPYNRSAWNSQHNSLKWLDPPYVYNVFVNDYEGFVRALHGAMNDPPPGPHVDAYMTEKGMRERMERLVETDWEGLARELKAEKEAEGTVFNWIM